ncbi:MAG: RNA methyltransferase [Clostridia bacterium]|nr:RNA methyltransferase [Clostridia bacterium]
MILTSKNNPFIKETVALKDKKGRKQTGLFLVEGVKMARECQKSDFEIERIVVSESFSKSDAYAEFETSETVCVSDDVFRLLSDEKTPQGVLCRVKIPVYGLDKLQESCLFLDGVSDPGNVGAIIRSANAAGYNEIYLTDDCADPYSPKAVRASMSGVFFTKIHQGNRESLLSALSDTPIIVADMRGENAFTFRAPEKFVLVIGNEANGVSAAVEDRATHTVKIPMSSTQESLNAAVSAGILMYLLKKEAFSADK